ncbi:hypothetical protein ACLOJK_010516 [Asimina triloba]
MLYKKTCCTRNFLAGIRSLAPPHSHHHMMGGIAYAAPFKTFGRSGSIVDKCSRRMVRIDLHTVRGSIGSVFGMYCSYIPSTLRAMHVGFGFRLYGRQQNVGLGKS